MNPEAVAAFTVPAFLFGVPLTWIIFRGWQRVIQLRIEEAKARAVADRPEDDALRADVEQLKHELSEVQERLDFAERMLARAGEREKLPKAPS